MKVSGLPTNYPIEILCDRIGSFLADRELIALRDGLVKYCGKKFHTANAGVLRASDLQQPMNWIGSNEFATDRLLIPLNQESNLLTERELMWYASNFRD